MGKSARLRLDDVRRAFRLIGDCRDLGRDRAAWSRRLAEGLNEGLDAVMTVVSHIEPGLPVVDAVRPGRTVFDVGWPTSRDREVWLGLLRAGRAMTYPTVEALYRESGVVIVRSRDQLVPDRDWRRSPELNEDRKPLGQDETLLGQLWHPRWAGAHSIFSINREVRARKFDARERAFLRLFLEELEPLAGRSITVDEEGPYAGMTPRARQVFEALLEGEPEKRIAARLGISGHTVHGYVKEIYRRFRVSSRGELSAQHHARTP